MTLIGDSIIKNVSGIDGCSIQSFRGDTISKLANKIFSKVAKLLPYDYVILHVGTNDIGNRAPFDNIIKDYANLLGIIRKLHPTVQIIVSAIIPRPCDYDVSDPMVRDINSYLNKVMSRDMNLKFVCTYKPLLIVVNPKFSYMLRMMVVYILILRAVIDSSIFSYKLLLICEKVNVISKCLI